MICDNPYVNVTGMLFGCGQCVHCRVNRRRVWAHRIMLEAAQYESNAFFTLTYSDEHLPSTGSLVPEHCQLWLKRLRKACEPDRFRFYLVGEYDDGWRPHYHGALFNFLSCRYGQSQYGNLRSRCCDRCELVRETWGKGFIHLGTVEKSSAGYLAKYVVKSMTRCDDERLQGRHPEFMRSSRRRGLGYSGLWELADVLMKYDLDTKLDDVPSMLRHGMSKQVMGRYLTQNLRKMVGKDEKAPQAALDRVSSELQPLREAAKQDANDPSFRSKWLQSTEGRRLSQVTRLKIFNGRK